MCFGRQLTKDTLSWVLCGLDWYAVSTRVTLSTFESYCLYSIFLQWLEIKYTCEEACTSEYLCDVWFMKLSICLNEAKKIHSNDNLGMLIKYSDCCVPFLIWRWSHSNQSSLKSLKWKMENHHSWSIAWLNVLCSHCRKTWDRCFVWSGPICSTLARVSLRTFWSYCLLNCSTLIHKYTHTKVGMQANILCNVRYIKLSISIKWSIIDESPPVNLH
jgi:hypothetical protein